MSEFDDAFDGGLDEEETSSTDGSTSGDNSNIDLVGVVNDKKAKNIVNPDIDKRYKIEEKLFKTTYSYENDPTKVAFSEKDNKLTTTETNPQLIKHMLQVAEDKGWESVKVSGKEEFKREAWLEAKLKGFEVTGFKPSEQDLRRLETEESKRNSLEQSTDEPPTASTVDEKGIDDKDTAKSLDDAELDPLIAKQEQEILDKEKQNVSLPPISIEGQEDRANELKLAISTLDKDEALAKHPELKPVYALQPSAVAYYRQQGGVSNEQENGVCY